MLAFIDKHKTPIRGSGDDKIDTIVLNSDGDVLHWYDESFDVMLLMVVRYFLKKNQFAYLDYGYNVRGLGWKGAPWNVNESCSIG